MFEVNNKDIGRKSTDIVEISSLFHLNTEHFDLFFSKAGHLIIWQVPYTVPWWEIFDCWEKKCLTPFCRTNIATNPHNALWAIYSFPLKVWGKILFTVSSIKFKICFLLDSPLKIKNKVSRTPKDKEVQQWTIFYWHS